MFEDADHFVDLFRGGFGYYLLITLPIFVLCSSNPVLASSEFNVQRMSQYDLHGTPFGCRASAINLEAKSLQTWSTSRHCILSRFQDMTIDQFREIRAKAGGLILLLPENITSLSAEKRQQLHSLEMAMLSHEISIPVYFSKFNTELESIIVDLSKIKLDDDDLDEINQPGKRGSALSEIMNSISANGYQVHVSGAHHTPNKQSKIPIVQGELLPILKAKAANADTSSSAHNQLPLIILTAHIETFGLINGQFNNVDAAIFFTLIDTFSKIHNSIGMAPKYRFLFLLTESGHLLNFQATKKWLETNIDENTSLPNIEFVLCLDAIGKGNSDDIYMHVSKPPKEGTSLNVFYKLLKQNAHLYANRTVEGVHKKINLADVQLAWEHERFSMKRIPAFTISSLKSYKDPQRGTIFETNRVQSLVVAQQNAKIIAETLANYVYGSKSDENGDSESSPSAADLNAEIFSGTTAITLESVKPWLQVRSSLLNNDIKNAFEKYSKNVKITYDKPHAREPDFMFFDGFDGVLNIYSVKPAIFDLFLTLVIIAYLSSVYCAIFYFGHFYSAICKFSYKIKSN